MPADRANPNDPTWVARLKAKENVGFVNGRWYAWDSSDPTENTRAWQTDTGNLPSKENQTYAERNPNRNPFSGAPIARPEAVARPPETPEQARQIAELQRQSAGDRNSLAQQAMARGYQNAAGQQVAQATLSRGVSGASAQRAGSAGAQQAVLGQGNAQYALYQREKANARGLLMASLNNARAQQAQSQNAYNAAMLNAQTLADKQNQFNTGAAINYDQEYLNDAQGVYRGQEELTDKSTALTDQTNSQLIGAAAGAAGVVSTIATSKKKKEE